MPKINTTVFPENTETAAFIHSKNKMKKQQRRKTTALVHNKRIKHAEQGIPEHYSVVDEKNIYEVYIDHIPEHTATVRQWVRKWEQRVDENGNPYSVQVMKLETIGEQTIPAHDVKKHRWLGTKPVTPYAKYEAGPNKKFTKRKATRKTRHSKELYQRSLYKKLFDVWWDLY